MLKRLLFGTEVQIENALENVTYEKEDLKDLVSVTSMNSVSLRTALKELILGEIEPERLKHDTIIPIRDKDYEDLTNLKLIEEFRITQNHN